MARPLQKKKNKSSLHRVRQKPKSKRINIKSSPLVAAYWDQTQTLSQNYHRLGLSSKLNGYTGGTEFKASNPSAKSNLAIPSSKAPKNLGNEEVRVVRDPKTGAILSVGAEGKERRNPLGDAVNDLSDDDDGEEGGEGLEGEGESRGIVGELEKEARMGRRKRPRVQSEREREWCGRLVERWGEDWGGMSRDRRLNPMQQCEGDLRRRVGLWMGGRRGEGVGVGGLGEEV